jgi:hypothetical protein
LVISVIGLLQPATTILSSLAGLAVVWAWLGVVLKAMTVNAAMAAVASF